ncbi:MAG: Crp/Fnr family transcriptional regulator [Sedimenticola sp.]|jgi:CRP-like cAMP-binding protein|nr:MAG: Crp/Fnr family transcriptional regulator [Sedimenticola sp.]
MVSVEGIDRMISEHPFFSGMEPGYQAMIAGCASNQSFEAGQYLIREGDNADHFYLIRHGAVAIEVHTQGQTSVTLETLHEGDVLGWSWLVPPYHWLFDARAIQLTRVIAIDAACLREKAEADHSLGYELYSRIMPVMSERLSAARLRLLDLYGSPRKGQ